MLVQYLETVRAAAQRAGEETVTGAAQPLGTEGDDDGQRIEVRRVSL